MTRTNFKILIYKCFLVLKAVFVMLFCVQSYSQASDDLADKELSDKYVYEGNMIIKEDFYQAEKNYRAAISKDKLNYKGAYNLSHAYYNAELYDEAQARLVEVTKNGDKQQKHQAFHNLGNIFMKENACKKAVEAYKNALRNNPKDDESRYNLAIAKECAKEESGGGGNDDEKKEDNKENKDKDKDKDNNESSKDKKDNKKEEEQKNSSKKNENDPKEKKNTEGQQGKLSPQQIKNLLEAMNNEENKVQEKMNASKTKGIKIKTDKDW